MSWTRTVTAVAAGVLACAFGGGAKATTFDWSYTGTFYLASGTLEASLISSGPHIGNYQVTSLVGSDNYGDTLSGPDTTFGSDNVLYVSSSSPYQLDATGLGILLTGPQHAISAIYLYKVPPAVVPTFGIYTDAFGACSYVTSTCNAVVDAGSFVASLAPVGAPTATPLPAAAPMLAGGLGLIGTLVWRRRRKTA